MTVAATKVQFSEEAIAAIAAALPANTDPARSALLPSILRAWAKEDLVEHLSREGRAPVRQREKRLRTVGERAQGLIEAIPALDQHGFFETALQPQMRHAGTGLFETDIAAAEHRRDRAVAWLVDLAEIFNRSKNGSENGKPDPDKMTRHYLIILDLAAIFELVSGEKPTRRVDCSGGTYGPFADFAGGVWVQIFGNRQGLSYAIRVWADEIVRQRKLAEASVKEAVSLVSRDLSEMERNAIESRFGAYSSFVANIQFRHSGLWRKLRRTSR